MPTASLGIAGVGNRGSRTARTETQSHWQKSVPQAWLSTTSYRKPSQTVCLSVRELTDATWRQELPSGCGGASGPGVSLLLPQPISLDFKKLVNLKGTRALLAGLCPESPRETLLLDSGGGRASLCTYCLGLSTALAVTSGKGQSPFRGAWF